MSSGPRYTDWTHTRVVGDRDAAAPYVPYARKLLGFVMDEAQRNGLGTHKVERTLEDGTHVIAEKHGDIPRVTIVPGPGGKGKRPIRTLDTFVFSASFNGRDNAGEVVNPAVLMRHDEDSQSWMAYFFRGSSPGKSASTAPRVGTYGDVFSYQRDYAAELLTFSRTWSNPEGDACAYTAPVGPFEVRFRHPATLYTSGVSALGHLVFALTEATSDAGWRVLAAARKDDYFYALCAKLGALPNTPPPAPSVHGVWSTSAFTDATHPYALLKVKVKAEDDPITGVRFLVHDANAPLQTLWSGNLQRCYGLWIFDEDCTEVVTYQLPANVFIHAAPGATPPSDPVLTSSLSSAAMRVALSIGADSASMSTQLDETAVFEDSGHVLRVVNVGGYAWDYVLGDWSCPAYRFSAAGDSSSLTVRTLVYADLRNNWFVFGELSSSTSGTARTTTNRVVIVGKGAETIAHEDVKADSVSGGYVSMYIAVLNHIAASPVSGLNRVFLNAGGVFYSNASIEVDGKPTAWSMMADHFGMSSPGYANKAGGNYGGIKVSARGAAWDISVNFGYSGADAGNYYYAPSAIMFHGAASTFDAVAVQTTVIPGKTVSYLTNGQLPGYYGGNVAMGGDAKATGIYRLGRPLPSQPTEREAA